MKVISAFTPPQRLVFFAVAYITGLTIFRLYFCRILGLVPDEAYYWQWSRHLDFCYRDKGPIIAWAIAVGTALTGDSIFGVRWVGVLLGAGTMWQLFALGRRLFDESVGLTAVLIASIIPILAVGSIVMTIDSPSVFFWAWAANLTWTAVQTNRKSAWILLGLAIGLGFLAKFTNVLQLGAVFLYLIWTPSCRRLICSAGAALMLFAFALCTTPILYWNWIHHWPNTRALASRSSIDQGFQLDPMHTLSFLGQQAGVISPLLFLGMCAAVAGLWISRSREDRIRLLLCNFLPIYACFTLFSLNAPGQPNWTAPALISGIILMVVFWRKILIESRIWRAVAVLALLLALVETVVMHDTSWLHLNPRSDPLKRTKGWEDLAAHTEKWRLKYSTDFIIGNHYAAASILAFYLPNQPATYTPTSLAIDNQYDLWPSYQAGARSSALFVTDEENPDAISGVLKREFERITLLEKFFTLEEGRPVREYKIYLCTNREVGP